jgi:hypothetical protein
MNPRSNSERNRPDLTVTRNEAARYLMFRLE